MVPRDVGFHELMKNAFPFVAEAWNKYSGGFPVEPNDFLMLKDSGSPVYFLPDMYGCDRNCLGLEGKKTKKGIAKPPKVKIYFVLATEVYNKYMIWHCQGRPKDTNGACIMPSVSAPAPTISDIPKQPTKRQPRKVSDPT